MTKILMIIAPQNFRDEEYLEPKKIFEQKGYEVITASKEVKTAIGRFGAKANIDIDIGMVNPKDYDAVVFVGGGGAIAYQNDLIINNIIEDFKNQNKLIGAICIAPTILAIQGILKGKKATVWNGDQEQSKILEQNMATYTGEDVTKDKLIITANGPAAAKKFANEIINQLD